jgi:hypothetical protein
MIIDVQAPNSDRKNRDSDAQDKSKKRKSVVGRYMLNSEDQKMIYCMNKIISLEDQEHIAKL